jgi:hypothetical protein
MLVVIGAVAASPHSTSSSRSTATSSGSGGGGSSAALPGGVSDGTHEVGPDLAPGKYKTAGPDPDSIVSSCYWARLNSTDGDFDSIITNGNTQGPATLTVKSTDAAVEFSGGCVWTKTS